MGTGELAGIVVVAVAALRFAELVIVRVMGKRHDVAAVPLANNGARTSVIIGEMWEMLKRHDRSSSETATKIVGELEEIRKCVEKLEANQD